MSRDHDGRPASLEDLAEPLPPWSEVVDVLTFDGGYNTAVVVAGTTLLGVAAGVVGVFALLRKRSLMADALSHATLPGICLAFLAATMLGVSGRSLWVLLLGATITGVLGVLCVQWLLRVPRVHEDAAIGIVLSVFFGAGAVLMSVIQNHAGSQSAGLSHFIYGQTAAMSIGDAYLMACIAVVAVVSAILLLKEMALVCFNANFARVDGWPVALIDLLMMSLVVIVTVAGLQAVGLILVVAMLIIPAVSARFWTERLWLLILLSGLIGGLSGYVGSSASALLPRKPAGAVIVLTAGVLFLLSMLVAPRRGILATLARRMRLSTRIAADHVLEEAFRKRKETISIYPSMPLLRRLTLPIYLRTRGYVTGRTMMLTDAGRERGERVDRNHQLWSRYLVTYADVAASHIDWTVDQVEHVLDPQTIAELEALEAEHRLPEAVPA